MIFLVLAIPCIVIIWKVCASIWRHIKALMEKIPEYESIDKNIKEGETNKKIDDFYGNSPKIKQLYENGTLFRRKAQLSNRLKLEDEWKEKTASVFIATVLSALITKLMDWNGLKTFLQSFVNEEIVNVVIIIMLLVFYGFIVMLFENILSSMENFEKQIYRYELEYIDKVIEKHIKTNLQNVKKLEYKKAEDLFYCRRFNAYIVKPQR